MSNGCQFHALIVEDETNWRFAIFELLDHLCQKIRLRHPFNYKIELASNGEDALHQVRHGQFDLLICDIDLKSDTVHGKSVIREADERDSCKELVVLTQLDRAEQLSFYPCNEIDKIEEFKITIHSFLRKHFPRYLYFPKRYPDPEKVLKSIRRERSLEELIRKLVMEENRFQQQKDYWEITYAGEQHYYKDRVGYHYIAYLLQHPEQDFYCLDLAQLRNKFPGESRRASRFEDASEAARDYLISEAAVDQQARECYETQLNRIQRQLADLDEELQEAEAFNDPGRIEALLIEIDQLETRKEQLSGQLSTARVIIHPEVKRARDAISKAIKDVLKVIREKNSQLYAHLKTAIHTGSYFRYTPPIPRFTGVFKETRSSLFLFQYLHFIRCLFCKTFFHPVF